MTEAGKSAHDADKIVGGFLKKYLSRKKRALDRSQKGLKLP